jgi:hypothetical protein
MKLQLLLIAVYAIAISINCRCEVAIPINCYVLIADYGIAISINCCLQNCNFYFLLSKIIWYALILHVLQTQLSYSPLSALCWHNKGCELLFCGVDLISYIIINQRYVWCSYKLKKFILLTILVARPSQDHSSIQSFLFPLPFQTSFVPFLLFSWSTDMMCCVVSPTCRRHVGDIHK